MSTRSGRRGGRNVVPQWDVARMGAWCWCAAPAVQLVTVGKMTGPVCARHRDPRTWPREIVVLCD